ncbi:MAG TPA: DUF6683 family protein [Pyrinomonadaceae bacterium]|nr:DUF6683 family protein [Pyrinomonadaceae bacterium]
MKTSKLTLAAPLLLLLFAGATAPARAQYSTAPTPSWYDYGVMRQQTINGWSTRDKMRRRRQQQAARQTTTQKPPTRRTGGTTSPTTSTGGGPSGQPANGTTTFRPVAASIMPQQLAREMAKTPAEREKLERMFSDLLENYRDNLRKSGGSMYDVARAASYLVAASHMVYFETEFLSDDKYEALRAQMHEVFASDPQFQRMSDRQKQQMFESYGIAATWIDAGYHIVKRKNDREGIVQWREMARRNFENMLGAEPEKVRFTNAGVEY